MSPAALSALATRLFAKRSACFAMGFIRAINQSAGLDFQSPGMSVHITVPWLCALAADTTQGLRNPNGGRNHFGLIPIALEIASSHRRSSSLISDVVSQKRFGCVSV